VNAFILGGGGLAWLDQRQAVDARWSVSLIRIKRLGFESRVVARKGGLTASSRLGLLDLLEDQGLTLTTVVTDSFPRGELLQGVDPVVAQELLQVLIPDPIAITDDLSHAGQDIASQ